MNGTVEVGDRQQRMLRWERVRQMLSRPVAQAMGGDGLFMVAAIVCFQAADWQKGLLASSFTIGMLCAPVLVSVCAARGWRANWALSLLMACGALGCALSAVADSVGVFMAVFMGGAILMASGTPLGTALWQQNVPEEQRGRYFSGIAWNAALAALVGGWLIAWYVGDDAWRYREVAVVGAVLLTLGAVATSRIPGERVTRRGRNPLAVLSVLWQDRLFGYISLCWYFIGIANLSTLPLRAEYLTNPVHGIAYQPGRVLLITFVVPLICELVSMPVWGRLFDRVNFLAIRIAINLLFALAIFTFFWPSIWLQVAGSVCYGLARGGGNVVWNLWVTKFAPPDRTADYMAVHSFLTGTRGLIGPNLAFLLLAVLGIQSIAWICTASALLATVMIIPVYHLGQRKV